MGFVKRWFTDIIESAVKKEMDNHWIKLEDMNQKLTQIEELIERLNVNSVIDSMETMERNTDKLNEMAKELKGVVSMSRASLKTATKERKSKVDLK